MNNYINLVESTFARFWYRDEAEKADILKVLHQMEIEKLGYHVSSVKDYWSTGEFSESGRWNDDKERCWFVEVQGPNKDIERLAIRALSTGPDISVDKECYMSVCLESGKR